MCRGHVESKYHAFIVLTGNFSWSRQGFLSKNHKLFLVVL